MGNGNKVGSSWGVWDLQIQTILDSGYKELKDYFQEIKAENPEKWDEFIDLVGSEEDALLFDSKAYFTQANPSLRHRCDNYAKTLFSYLKVFSPHVRCVGVTDHNHLHDELMDSLIRSSATFDCKVLPGVEINADGVHLLVYFPHPPCEKSSYSEGIKAFLATLQIFNVKSGSAYSLAQGGLKEVIDKIARQHAIFVFAHCNSDNGLFQERGKTDRTHLAEIFNHTSPTILQTRSKAKAEELVAYIRTKPALQSNFVVTIASDGRALKEIGAPDESGNMCFIKGAPTVEGLRQAIFEPETRVYLGKSYPIPPIHRIDQIDLNFPEGSKLNDDLFCLAGNHTIRFSPHYTCLIGGRGTGKSTILNLLQEKIQPKANAFFAGRKLTSPEGKILITSDYIKIDDDADKKTIDFLSQNEIERFATNAQALTAALYARLERENQGKIKKAQEALALQLADFQKHIDSHREKIILTEKIDNLEKERQSQEKILNSFQSVEYKALAEKVAAYSELLRAFQSSKQRFKKLSIEVEKLITPNSGQDSDQSKNDYDKAYESVLAFIRQAKAAADSIDTTELNFTETKLETNLRDAKVRLSAYLSEKGLKPESQQDVADANEKISQLKTDIEEATAQLSTVTKQIDLYSQENLHAAKLSYESTLIEQIRAINSRLENLNAQVKTIKLEFRFDMDAAKRSAFEEVKRVFLLNPTELGTKENALQEALFCLEPVDLNLKEAFIEALERRPKGRELSRAQTALIELFQSDWNFELYKLILKRALSDPFSFKIINVYYDGKLLPESSFGQRCTAAVVLLLLLGNHPIVIDEPEGHLDSLLIANYLVELIKKAKEHRQIIFATHNANLVVNGDADLVYHLEMTDQKRSTLTPVVLEDPEQRNRIVSLEGGHDAFRKRESKYRKSKVA